MPGSSREPEDRFRTITTKAAHDHLVAQCTKSNSPTILHVYNSSVPRCQSFITKFEIWARDRSFCSGERIQYARMDYTSETSCLFKFAPNQLPITVMMVGPGWARTVTGTDMERVESLAEEMMQEYRKLTAGH
ncbi:hypothetical protein SVAN01_05343 [Stagonosporopsis vannaccii]|nr:hypothetical protein SVAN01_05343 [Stagonosporopsis vannaccii]